MASPTTSDPVFPELTHLLQRLPPSLPSSRKIPIVLVPGFVGWGSPMLDSFNYFGGFDDLAGDLVKNGWTVIIPQLGPLSSNWERACELYAQLTHGSYDQDVWDVTVNYGGRLKGFAQSTVATGRRQAYSRTPMSNGESVDGSEKTLDDTEKSCLKDWKWSQRNPVHFVAHSQGGNTVRYLIHLLRHGDLHPYFRDAGRDTWVKSLVTLATPHNGSTVTDVFRNIDTTDGLLVRQSITTASFESPQKRAYDPQLDHWGVYRLGNEDFQTMFSRLNKAPDGYLYRWFQPDNQFSGLYDNSVIGVDAMNRAINQPSPNVYYFTFSLAATVPTTSLYITTDDVLALINSVPPLDKLGPLLLPITVPAASAAAIVVNTLGSYLLPAIIKRVLLRLPPDTLQLGPPGSQVPRGDMFPTSLIFGYEMGGYKLTKTQSQILGVRSVEMQENDGIVNTISMKGPRGSPIVDVDAKLAALIPGIFYHMGKNNVMDHLDVIGIIVNAELMPRVKQLYVDIAELLYRLPLPEKY